MPCERSGVEPSSEDLRDALNDVVRRRVSAFNGEVDHTVVKEIRRALLFPRRTYNISVAKERTYTSVKVSHLANDIGRCTP